MCVYKCMYPFFHDTFSFVLYRKKKKHYFVLLFFTDLLMSCSLNTVMSQIFHTLPVSPVIQRDPVGLVSCTWFATWLAPANFLVLS